MPLTAQGPCRSSRPSSLIRTWRRGQRRSCGPNSAADMLLCDTGVLLAAGNVKDHHHAACLALMRAAEGPLLVPSPVLGEIGYLLQSRVGPHAEVTFLKSFGGNGFHVAEVEILSAVCSGAACWGVPANPAHRPRGLLRSRYIGGMFPR